jgi:signal transduction protein with GAF and PtsI domain
MNNAALPTKLIEAIHSASIADALDATLNHFGCQAGTYHELRDGMLHLAAACHIPPPVLALVQQVPIGKGIAGLAAQRLEPVSLCNLQTDSSGQARPGAKATGMEGSLAVPALGSDGKLHGVLGIAKATAHEWTDVEKNSVSAVASLFAARTLH